jgi:hypothetical protein
MTLQWWMIWPWVICGQGIRQSSNGNLVLMHSMVEMAIAAGRPMRRTALDPASAIPPAITIGI